MKTIIIYGTTTGNTEAAAKSIAKGFEDSKVVDVSELEIEDLVDYDLLLLGTATAGVGELQDEWEEKIDQLDFIDFEGKTVGIFGAGDQTSYPDSFAGSLNYLYEKVENSGAKIVGFTSTDGYEFDESESVRGDKFVGLVIDDDNQAQYTDKRIADWIAQIKSEIA